jgi:hypothetical protein
MQALILVATKGWFDKLARIGVLRASNRPAHAATSALQHRLLPNFLPNNSANVLFGSFHDHDPSDYCLSGVWGRVRRSIIYG